MLPRRWKDDVFRYCSFESLDLQGEAFEGVLIDCNFAGSTWYWGLFNTTRLIGVEFRDCVFRGTAFHGCIFANCRFLNCSFVADNLRAECRFTECHWSGCEQAGCIGLPKDYAAERSSKG